MNYNITIDCVRFYDDMMIIYWLADVGFGQLTVYRSDDKDDEKFDFDTERMSNNFRDEVLKKAIEYMINNSL